MTKSEATGPKPGDTLPPFDCHITTARIMAYGAATWDWHRLHYDADYARSQGLPGVVLDGQAFGAFFARAAMDWLGPRAFVRKLSFRMRSMVSAGDTLRCEGAVTAVEKRDGGIIVSVSQTLKIGDRLAADAVTEIRIPP